MITSHRNFNRDAFYPVGENGGFDYLLKEFKIEITEPTKPFTILPQFASRPDLVALAMYGNSRLWWIITEFNGISDIWNEFVVGVVLDLPSEGDMHRFHQASISKGVF